MKKEREKERENRDKRKFHILEIEYMVQSTIDYPSQDPRLHLFPTQETYARSYSVNVVCEMAPVST